MVAEGKMRSKEGRGHISFISEQKYQKKMGIVQFRGFDGVKTKTKRKICHGVFAIKNYVIRPGIVTVPLESCPWTLPLPAHRSGH